jgi:hypothetical protein
MDFHTNSKILNSAYLSQVLETSGEIIYTINDNEVVFGYFLKSKDLNNLSNGGQAEIPENYISLNCDFGEKIKSILKAKSQKQRNRLKELINLKTNGIIELCLHGPNTFFAFQDVTLDCFTNDQINLLLEKFHIQITPCVLITLDFDQEILLSSLIMHDKKLSSVQITSISLIPKNALKSFQFTFVPDIQPLKTIVDEGEVTVDIINGATFCKIGKDDKIKMVGNFYGSPFSSPKSRNKTYQNIISFCKQYPKVLVIGDWNNYGDWNSENKQSALEFIVIYLISLIFSSKLNQQEKYLIELDQLVNENGLKLLLPQSNTFMGASYPAQNLVGKIIQNVFRILNLKIDYAIINQNQDNELTSHFPPFPSDHKLIKLNTK